MRVGEQEPKERFDALFKEHVADIVAYCGWRTQSRADAEDAVSDVFLAAWRRIGEVPEGPAARPWLYATARRVMANQARSGRRRALLHVRLNPCLPIPLRPQTESLSGHLRVARGFPAKKPWERTHRSSAKRWAACDPPTRRYCCSPSGRDSRRRRSPR